MCLQASSPTGTLFFPFQSFLWSVHSLLSKLLQRRQRSAALNNILPITAQDRAKQQKQQFAKTICCSNINQSGTASDCVALTFALVVFLPSRSTVVQLRGKENAVLHHSRKSVFSQIMAQDRAKQQKQQSRKNYLLFKYKAKQKDCRKGSLFLHIIYFLILKADSLLCFRMTRVIIAL